MRRMRAQRFLRLRAERLVGGPAAAAVAVVVAAVLAASTALPVRAEDRAEPLPKELNGVGITEHPGEQLPLDLEFQDEDGKTVRLGDFFDGRRPVILNLVYFSCPMLCTLVLNGVVNGMKGIPWVLGREYVNVTVSIDPSESPVLAARKKASYLESYGHPETAKDWHFLTGRQESITRLADVVGFRYRFNPETREFIHTAGTFICTPGGRLSRYLYGIEYDPQTVKLALSEASSNRIGTTADKLILYCFHYDATTGRYAPSAVKLMRIAGGVIAAGVAFLLLALWRGEARRRRSALRTRPTGLLGALLVAGLAATSSAAAGSEPTFWMPVEGSAAAPAVDWLFRFILVIAAIFFVLTVVLMTWFVLRYRRRAGVPAERTATHSAPLEAAWTIVPIIAAMSIFYFGFKQYLDMSVAPANSYEILVTAQKWNWQFTYPNGYTDAVLHVPVDTPVRLVLTSEDVIHGFYIPAFRLKKDAVPGRYNKAWFRATRPGEYTLLCSQYCGREHSNMMTSVVVHPPGEFEKWLAGASAAGDKMSPAEAGARLFKTRGCASCHTLGDAPGVGPSFKGIYGHEVVLSDGRKVPVDEDYLRESILDPAAKVVAGFDPVMPTYRGRITDKEITALIEYIKSLQQAAENAIRHGSSRRGGRKAVTSSTTGSTAGGEARRPGAPGPPVDNYLTHGHGWRSWAFTLDHKRIAVMYLVAILASFLLGGVLAGLIRTELLGPTRTIMSAESYNRTFTLHGAIMVFLFVIPGTPAAMGNFVIPLMLGAKDLAFPRMNLVSFYLYVLGALFSILAIVTGGVDTGWTFYTPYSTTTNSSVIAITLGIFILGFSSIFTGINFIVTIHKLRPAGMTWFKMPLFLWASYATAVIQVVATPVLGITLLLLIAERALGIGIFDPRLGGDPVLYQHFFWFYSHPAVYIMILPGMGIISEVISVFSRKHIFGYRAIAFSSVAIAVIGFLVWGHHMFVSGQSPLADTIFSFLTFGVAIPSGIKVFNWLATMYKGSISLETPMLYVLSFLFLFAIGGLSGLFLGALAMDVHLHDTYFVVAHFHYVIMGGTVMAFMAGLHYWWPKMFGRMYGEKWARVAALLIFVGMNTTFFTQFLLGTHGMPRRYYNYQPQFTPYHRLSSVGAAIMGVGFVIAAICLIRSLRHGAPAPDNPWGANTNEWKCASPPPHDNFAEAPPVEDPYEFARLTYDPGTRGWVASGPPAQAAP